MSDALKLKPQIEIKLVVQTGPHAGQRFSFSKTDITIGRAPENDIVLLNDPLISRQHVKVIVIGSDVEIVNMSQKNSVLVQGESVQKWKMVNEGTFVVGDSEFRIFFDLGHGAAPLQKKLNANLQVVSPMIRPAALHHQAVAVQRTGVAKSTNQLQNNNLTVKSNAPQQIQQQRPQMQQNIKFQTASRAAATAGKPLEFLLTPKFRFYLIVAVVAAGAYLYLNSSDKGKKTETKKSILKYSDEVSIKLNSKNEKENLKKMEKLYEFKNSPTILRAQENFIKGMRDFHLGNYARSLEFFQVVLNLQPGHDLAKRHLYLSRVRFDEVLKAKLMLGESNYQKHNFRMCQSFYEQVLDMLQGKSSDQNYQIAAAMADKCKLAELGVR